MKLMRCLFVTLLTLIYMNSVLLADQDCDKALEIRGKKRLLVNDRFLLERLSVCESIDTEDLEKSASMFCSDKSATKSSKLKINAVIKQIPIGFGSSRDKYARDTYCDSSNNFDFDSYKSDFCEFDSKLVSEGSQFYDVDNSLTPEQVQAYIACKDKDKSIDLSCTAQRQGEVIYFYMYWKAESDANDMTLLLGAEKIETSDTLAPGHHYKPIVYKNEGPIKVVASVKYKGKSYSCMTSVQNKVCENPVYREGTGAVCGAVYNERAGEPCGVNSYNQQQGSQCGPERYNSKAEFPCDVKKYNLGRSKSVCGSTEKTLTQPDGGCAACGGALQSIPGVIRQVHCEEWRQAGNPACRLYYEQANECEDSSFGVASYETCENASFGVRSWKTCRHPDFGIESYDICRNPAFGVESFKTCRDSTFGLESCED